ncbi:hypothetical protein [Brucella sp. BO2]|uniref:hypothetical protein n=1 Tax=Brucella sp. BO2 TaxID=693750 RepID=UPI00046D4BEC|nr:hypothetical protein [Brucella sp. BO2]
MTAYNDIPNDIKNTVELGELENLVNAHSRSSDFDGNALDEMNEIKAWVARAILAERERCAKWAAWGRGDQEGGFMAESIEEWILSGDTNDRS